MLGTVRIIVAAKIAETSAMDSRAFVQPAVVVTFFVARRGIKNASTINFLFISRDPNPRCDLYLRTDFTPRSPYIFEERSREEPRENINSPFKLAVVSRWKTLREE